MKLRLYKTNGYWKSSVRKGEGGENSLIAARASYSLWYSLGVFNWKNIYRALTEK